MWGGVGEGGGGRMTLRSAKCANMGYAKHSPAGAAEGRWSGVSFAKRKSHVPTPFSVNACAQAPCTNKRMSAYRPTNGRLEMLAEFALHLGRSPRGAPKGSVRSRRASDSAAGKRWLAGVANGSRLRPKELQNLPRIHPAPELIRPFRPNSTSPTVINAQRLVSSF